MERDHRIGHEIHQGLSRTSMKLAVGRNTVLKVRWPSQRDEGTHPEPGERVMTCIAANGVLLGVPCVCPGDARWNRWTGRVVLVEHTDPPVLTIKIHGETWTIKSTQPIVGLDRPPRAWDPVNIVVDPHVVRVIWDRAAIWPHKY